MGTYRVAAALGCLTVAIAAGACADSRTAAPGAPSPAATSTAPAPAAGGASIAGLVVGMSGTASAAFRTLATGMTVTVSGTSLSSPVDDSGRFELHGVPSGRVELHFSGRGADARLSLDSVADQETIEVVVRINGSSADVEDDRRETPDNRIEIEGIVTEVSAAAGTMRVRDTLVTVPAAVPVRHGSTTLRLSDIRVGDRVHVHATKNGAATIATEVELQNDHPGDDNGNNPAPAPPPDGHGNPGGDRGGEAEANGVVSARSGSCPSLAFTVGSARVTTSAATEFKDVTCSALANGDRVEVKGSRQSNGTISATRVEKQH